MRRLDSSAPSLSSAPRWISLVCASALSTLSLSACEIKIDGDGDDDVAGSEDEDTGEETGEPWEPVPARGNISLTTVVANQGVDVPISVDGNWVGPADRNTYILSGRDTLIRAYWETPEDWTPREINAVLELTFSDGTTKTIDSKAMVDTESYGGDLNRGFYWPVLAADAQPGVKFHITLWEAGPGFDDLPESTTLLESPVGAPELIGIQSEPMQLKVEFVPVRYNSGTGCVTDTSTLTDEEKQNFIDNLYEQNPVQEVVFNFRDDATINWNSQLESLAELWEPLYDLRDADGAGPNVYYYALVNVCGGGIGDAAGIAPGTPPPTKDGVWARVSSGVWITNNVKYSYHTFVHELGHNQGRPHVYCAGGGAAGTDPTYPYDNGVIGTWGFGIRFFKLYSPTGTFDYMTYCGPNWVSDWTWSKIFNQIMTLTSWDFEGKADAEPQGPQGRVLMGVLMENGEERWFTAPGGAAPDYFSGAERVAIDYGQGELEVPAAIELLEDGSRLIVAPLPQPELEPQQLRRIDSQGVSRSIDVSRVDTRANYTFSY